MTLAVNIAQGGANNVSFRNRIINGAMVIDQRNAGASVTAGYAVDRWQYDASQGSKFSIQQNAGSVTPPAGFANYLGFTVTTPVTIGTTDYFTFLQRIEGFNVADLAWGTASAATITLSFRVYSSLTGTFGGSIKNSAENRSYPFSYTISTANTWTSISITIAGDTSGTWLTTNGKGLNLFFGLGVGTTYSGTAGAWAAANYASATGAVSVVGTSGATFYITGVQLEAGTTASPFEYRQYGTELMLCQRYYQITSMISGAGNSTTVAAFATPFQVPMRASPTLGQQGVIQISSGTADFVQSTTVSGVSNLGATNNSMVLFVNNFTGLTANAPYIGYRNSANTNALTLSAEL